MDLGLTDQISDRVVKEHNLKGRDHTALHLRDQLLGNHGLHDHGELCPHLLLLCRREAVNDSVYGVGRADCVQGRNDQMTGLCRSQCCLDGFFIAHLTNQNNIRCLTERCAKARHVAFGIQADFSLGNNTLIVPVQVLDRILQRDHMGIACLVDLVNDTGQRGTLTASRRSRYQNKALRHTGNIDDHLRDVQIAEIRQVECDHTDNSCQ